MNRARLAVALSISVAMGSAVMLRADVKTQEKSQVKFEGMLGRMMGLFGGRAAKEGVVSNVAVKGDRKATISDSTGQIIDLAEEKVYDLDIRNKTYKVTTFAELRRRLQEAQAKAAESADQAPKGSDKGAKEYEIDFNVKETGQKKTISSYDCREIVMTIAVREKGKTLDQSGGIVMTSNSWLAPKIPAMAEIAAFDRRYAQKLEGPLSAASAEQMAAAMGMFPGMKEAMTKLQAENVNTDGTAISTSVTIEAVKSQEQMASGGGTQESQGSGGGLGGVLGGLGRRMGKKTDDAGSGTAGNRSTIMTMNTEVLSVAASVAPTDVALPAGFQQK